MLFKSLFVVLSILLLHHPLPSLGDPFNCCPGITHDPERRFNLSKDHSLPVNIARMNANEFSSFENAARFMKWLRLDLNDVERAAHVRFKTRHLIQYERVVHHLILNKRGDDGPAPTSVMVRWYKSTGTMEEAAGMDVLYQNDLQLLGRYDRCQLVDGFDDFEVTERWDKPSNLVWTAQRAPIDVCAGYGESTNCRGDEYTHKMQISFDKSLSQVDRAFEPDTDVWEAADGRHKDAIPEELCMDLERFWKDFCSYFAGSDISINYRNQRHRYTKMPVDNWNPRREDDRGDFWGSADVIFLARFDTGESWRNDIIEESPGASIRLRIRESWTEDDVIWQDMQTVWGKVVDHVAAEGGRWVDRSECAREDDECCYRVNGPAKWEERCWRFKNDVTCTGEGRDRYCEWGPCKAGM